MNLKFIDKPLTLAVKIMVLTVLDHVVIDANGLID